MRPGDVLASPRPLRAWTPLFAMASLSLPTSVARSIMFYRRSPKYGIRRCWHQPPITHRGWPDNHGGRTAAVAPRSPFAWPLPDPRATCSQHL
jgi:hypothetical protein